MNEVNLDAFHNHNTNNNNESTINQPETINSSYFMSNQNNQSNIMDYSNKFNTSAIKASQNGSRVMDLFA